MLVPSNKAIDYAFERMKTFSQVNHEKTKDEKIESLDLMASAVGLEYEKFEYLIKLTNRYCEDLGSVVMGVLIGLFMMEYEQERHETLDQGYE